MVKGMAAQRKQARKRRQDGAGQANLQLLRERAHRRFGDRAICRTKRGLKMSEVIVDFAEPLLEQAGDEGYESALAMGVVAWNLALLPAKQRERAKKSLVKKLPGKTRRDKVLAEDYVGQIEAIMRRKHEHFGHIKRFVVDYLVTESGDRWHVSVASTPCDPDDD